MRRLYLVPKLRIAHHFLAAVRDTSKTDSVFSMVDELNRLAPLTSKFPDTPDIAAYLDDPFSQGFPDLQALRALPEDTFGFAVARHMDQLGVDFAQFDRRTDAASKVELIERHMYEVHDLWHVLTGLGAGPANEIALQAFSLAQVQWVASLVLVSLGLVRVLMVGGEELNPVLDAITMGWSLGRQTRPMFGVDWRPHLERPLAEVRADFGLVAVTPGALLEIPEQMAG